MYLRPYRSADLDALFDLDRVCFAPQFRFSRAMMRRAVESAEAVVLLACDAGADGTEVLLGFCAVQMDQAGGGPRFGYVSTLDIAPASRGQGVAQALMRDVQDEVTRRGGTCMVLHVWVENLPAVSLYERLGYLCMGREQSFYGNGFDAWVYRRDLVSADDG